MVVSVFASGLGGDAALSNVAESRSGQAVVMRLFGAPEEGGMCAFATSLLPLPLSSSLCDTASDSEHRGGG